MFLQRLGGDGGLGMCGRLGNFEKRIQYRGREGVGVEGEQILLQCLGG